MKDMRKDFKLKHGIFQVIERTDNFTMIEYSFDNTDTKFKCYDHSDPNDLKELLILMNHYDKEYEEWKPAVKCGVLINKNDNSVGWLAPA